MPFALTGANARRLMHCNNWLFRCQRSANRCLACRRTGRPHDGGDDRVHPFLRPSHHRLLAKKGPKQISMPLTAGPPPHRASTKVGRNDSCPCSSVKKFKNAAAKTSKPSYRSPSGPHQMLHEHAITYAQQFSETGAVA